MRILALLGALVSFWLVGTWVRSAQTHLATEVQSELIEGPESHAGASLIGEFRSSLSGYLWAKTDEYLHGGVMLRAMTDSEKQDQTAHRATSDDELMRHGEETSVIPSADQDARGIWGEIERNVKPYFDVRGHKHANTKETIPLFRLITVLDPHFVPAYVVGANTIAFADHSRVREALLFLDEGIKHNPLSIALHTECARYLIVRRKDYFAAEKYLLHAMELASQNEIRGDDIEALEEAFRWLVLLYRDTGRIADAYAWAQAGLDRYPDDSVLQRIVIGDFSGSQIHAGTR